MSDRTSEQIRASLEHPVIDGDGHTIEFMPMLHDYLKDVGGSEIYSRFERSRPQPLLGRGTRDRWYKMTELERQRERATRPSFWVGTGNTYDRATAMLPDLRRKRMDELGLDFSILYPTGGLEFPLEQDEEIRRAFCRAINIMNTDLYGPHADRMTHAAVIPMHTPQEAIAELEHAVGTLGMKAIYIPAQVPRPLPALEQQGERFAGMASYLDLIALDSPHDYDPFWARCVELGVAPTCHSGGQGWGSRTSISNYMYNHIGHFAAAGEGLCKALFFAGVTRRFPTLKFGFLEGGTAWASTLLGDITGHWQKRNVDTLKQTLNPANLDMQHMLALFTEYGECLTAGREDKLEELLGGMTQHLEDLDDVDDFRACEISAKADIHDLFVPRFYFGCEADDPSNVWAFKGETRLRAIFSSDIGHWDVPDIRECLEEAYELVEHGDLTERDFEEFVCTNPVTLHGGMNADFFNNTTVESQATQILVLSH
jgi:predicted TIM-barrel fold metal-dependent hydrolase